MKIFSVCIFACVLSVVTANFFMDEAELRDTESVIVESKTRLTRSLEQLYANDTDPGAHDLTLNFRYKGQSVHISLKKNDHISTNPAIFVINDNGQIERFPTYKNNQGRTLYQGLTTRASMIRDCSNARQECEMYGTFLLRSEEMAIRPSWRGDHVVGRIPLARYTARGQYGTIEIDKKVVLRRRRRSAQNSTNLIYQTQPEAAGQYPDVNVIEVFAFTDESEFRFFKEREGTKVKAIKALQLFLALQMNAVDLKYRSLGEREPTIPTVIYFAGALVARKPKDAPWLRENKNGRLSPVSTITAFGEYQKTLTSNIIPKYDHAMAITRKEMISESHGGKVLGLAYTKGMCLPDDEEYRVSLVSDTNYQLDFIMAHEVGHSLGARHDISYSNPRCPDYAQFIMTTKANDIREVNKKNFWKFSACSAREIKRYIQKMDTKYDNQCLKNHNFQPKEFRQDSKLPLPGTVHSLDEQCQFSLGRDARFCPNSAAKTYADDMCWKGHTCGVGGRCSVNVLPYDGSPCGNNMWCCKGECVPKPASGKKTTCES